MALVTFVTNDQLKAIQTGFANKTTTQLDSARETAYSLIVTALSEGGYSVATIVAAPTTWPFLKVLETRLAALDLLGGGSASASEMQGGDNWTHWEKMVQSWLDGLTNGMIALIDSSGTITNPPNGKAADTDYGILSDTDRDPGIDLDEPENWAATDDMDVW